MNFPLPSREWGGLNATPPEGGMPPRPYPLGYPVTDEIIAGAIRQCRKALEILGRCDAMGPSFYGEGNQGRGNSGMRHSSETQARPIRLWNGPLPDNPPTNRSDFFTKPTQGPNLDGFGGGDDPSTKLSNQNHGEGSEQRDHAGLPFQMPGNTSSRAQACPPWQGISDEENFRDFLFGRNPFGQGESGQRDHLQEQEGKRRKTGKILESDAAQDCHCKQQKVSETTALLQGVGRIVDVLERALELKELKYKRKTSGAEQATSQGDGLRAADAATTHWSGGQPNLWVPRHQDPVGQPLGDFPLVDSEGVPQSTFNDIHNF